MVLGGAAWVAGAVRQLGTDAGTNKAWTQPGARVGSWERLGRVLGRRASGKLRESLGRASASGKLGEMLGRGWGEFGKARESSLGGVGRALATRSGGGSQPPVVH